MKILIQHTKREKTEMADIDDTYKVKKFMKFTVKRAKLSKPASAFKRNVSKKSRKEWGARMQFFRSL